jgi:hypothetical protein
MTILLISSEYFHLKFFLRKIENKLLFIIVVRLTLAEILYKTYHFNERIFIIFVDYDYSFITLFILSNVFILTILFCEVNRFKFHSQ